jgi:hypothetical protein
VSLCSFTTLAVSYSCSVPPHSASDRTALPDIILNEGDAAVIFTVNSGHCRSRCVSTDHSFFPLEVGIDPVLGIEVAEDICEALLEGNPRRYLKLARAS